MIRDRITGLGLVGREVRGGGGRRPSGGLLTTPVRTYRGLSTAIFFVRFSYRAFGVNVTPIGVGSQEKRIGILCAPVCLSHQDSVQFNRPKITAVDSGYRPANTS